MVDLRDSPPVVGDSNGTPPCSANPDLVCPPAPALDASWNACPFPRRADVAKIDDARVLLEVSVGATGFADGVRILEDPGYDFGRAAAICALANKYVPAHYSDGRAIRGSLKMRIHFSRPAP